MTELSFHGIHTHGERIFYEDVIKIMAVTEKGCWAARGARMPWLPVRVHLIAVRASGRNGIVVGQRMSAHIVWRPSGAIAIRFGDARDVVLAAVPSEKPKTALTKFEKQWQNLFG